MEVTIMGYTDAGLREKIHLLHPEIAANGIVLAVDWDEAGQQYRLVFKKEGQELGGALTKQDADACLDDRKCLNLAVLVTQLLAEFEQVLSPRKPG
jgi:hypothetical protein